MTPEQVASHQSRVSGVARTDSPVAPARTRSKYSAVRTLVGDMSFASKAEAERYRQLKLLESAGQLSGLKLQPRFPMRVAGVLVTTYVGDFRYMDSSGAEVVEDVKGFKTKDYVIKSKLFAALYAPLKIIEITSTRRKRRGSR